MSIRKTLFRVFLIIVVCLIASPSKSLKASGKRESRFKESGWSHQMVLADSLSAIKIEKYPEEKKNADLLGKGPESEISVKEPRQSLGDLTDEERAWLDAHSEISIGVMAAWPPMNFLDQSGRPSGIGADYINALNQRLGGIFKIVPAPFDENLEMIKSKKLDCLMDVTPKPEREEFLNFTRTYLNIPHVIIARKDSKYYSSEDDLSGKKLALEKGFGNVKYFREKYPDVKIAEYGDTSLALGAVARGEADAYAGNRAVAAYIMEQELLGSLLVFQGQLRKPGSILAIGVRKDWPELASILDKTLASMTIDEVRGILRRWAGLAVEDQEISKVNLTEEERRWMEKHPLIRVSNKPDYAPFDFIEKGKPSGFSIDFVDLLAKKAGLRLEYVQDTLANLSKMGEDKKIDLLHTVFYTKERDKYFLFTEPYKSVVNAIYVRDDIKGVKSISDLSGKKVILPKGDSISEILPKIVPDANYFFVETYEALLKALSLGEGDATVLDSAVANYLIRKNTLTNILPAGEAIIPVSDRDPRYRLAIRQDWPELHSILQKTMDQITRDEMAELESRWFGLSKKMENEKIPLDEKEKAFLKANPVIRVHNEKDRSPLNYHAYGQPRGLSIDYMNLVADRLGLKVKYVTGPSWNDFLGMIKQKDLDVMLNIIKTDDRQKYIIFTEPYVRNPNVIISPKEKSYENIEQLYGKTVAFPKGFFYEELLARSYPQITRLPLNDTTECLKALSLAKADAALGEEAVIKSLVSKNMLKGLFISSEANIGDPDLQNLRLGVRNDWPILYSAITKAMADISPQEIRQVRAKWLQHDIATTSSEKTTPVSYARVIFFWIGIFLILFLLSFLMIKTKKKENIAIQFGSPLFRAMVLIGLSLFVIIVGLIGWVTLEENKRGHLEDVDINLKGGLSLLEDRLELWLSERKNETKYLGQAHILVDVTRRLLSLAADKKNLLASDALAQARSLLKRDESNFDNNDFFIISPDYLTICSMNDEKIGTTNPVFLKYPESVKRSFKGEVEFVSTMIDDIPDDKLSDSDKRQPSVFFIAPIQDAEGHILAVVALEMNPWKNFALDSNTFGDKKTAEIYAFDKEGRMISESRFDDQLRDIGLLAKDKKSALNIEIRDPGVNLLEGGRPKQERFYQPITHMAFRAIQLGEMMKQAGISKGHSKIESNVKGYRDYRGVQVFGAWLWNMDMNFGIAAEVDADEAMSNFFRLRFMVAGILGFTMVMSIGAVFIVLFLGERTSRALMEARDDLELKVAERTSELKDNQERFAALLESAPDAMVVSGDTGEILLVNSQAEKLFGYDRKDMLGRPVEILVPESIRASHPAMRNHYMTDSMVRRMGACGLELTAQVKNGDLIPVDITLSPIETESGMMIVASIRDITERKLAEDALRVSEEKVRLILESVGDGIFGVGLDGRIAFINSAASRLLGYDADELIGQSIHEKIHHTHVDGRPYSVEDCPMFKSYKEGSTETISDEMLWRKDGTGFFVEYTATPMSMNSDVLGAVIVFRDITGRKKAEEALRKSEERYALVVRGSNDGIWGLDSVTKETYFSPRFMEMLGYGPDGFPHDMEEWANRIHPDDMEMVMAVNKSCSEGDMDSFQVEYRIKHKDGTWRWFLTRGANIKDFTGRVIRLAGTHTDITESKRMEEALISERERLQQILDTSPVGVAFSTKGIIQFANPMFMRMFDAGVGDAYPNLYVNAEEREHLLSKLKANEKIEDYELKMYGRGGEIRDMLINYMPIRYGEEYGILGWLLDITDRKKAEQEIKDKFEELTRFRKLAVGREKRMIELKAEINEILKEAGMSEKYKIH